MNTMRRFVQLLFVFASVGFILQACNTGSKPAPLNFSTDATEDLRLMVEEAPSDFTWEFFEEHILIGMQTTESNWEGEVLLSGFQILNGEVADRVTTTPILTNAEQLESGISTGNLTLPEFTITDWGEFRWKSLAKSFKKNWGDKKVRSSISLWDPDQTWSTSEIEEAILSEVELGENETLFVVYVHLSEEAPQRQQTTQPFGILMRDEAS